MGSAEYEPIYNRDLGRSPNGVQEKPLVKGSGAKPPETESTFFLSEMQMTRKFAHFCYHVNCSNVLFERILLRFCHRQQTLSAVWYCPCKIIFVHAAVSSVWSLYALLHRIFLATMSKRDISRPHPEVHNVSQRRQREDDRATATGNVQIKLGEVWECSFRDMHTDRKQIHMHTDRHATHRCNY